MGAAVDWQSKVTEELLEFDVDIYNPRRVDWDSSWEQSIDNPQFNAQVNWELDQLEAADIIFMYFDPNTKSPISLLELGMFAKTKRMIVVCPPGFWRRGNVEVVCRREGVAMYDTLDDALDSLKITLELLS